MGGWGKWGGLGEMGGGGSWVSRIGYKMKI